MLIPVYGFDEESGLPLVPYVPELKDRVDVPEWPDFDSVQMRVRGVERWSNNNKNADLAERNILSDAAWEAKNNTILALQKEWNKAAKEKGHKWANLYIDIHDGFVAVYLRLPNMDELQQLKENARIQLHAEQKQDELWDNHMKDVKRLLGEDYTDE